MVLRKPYAFLIKNFRLIHILFSVVIFFIIKKFSNIADFFSTYVKSPNYQFINEISQYINFLFYVAIFIAIAFSLTMLILMHNKKKPVTFYILSFAYYIIVLIFVAIAHNLIPGLNEASLTHQAARIYRDIYLIVSFPQYYFIIISIVRGVGFDVKKFNFSKDLEELEIKREDNEEFEFVVGTDSYIQKRKVRRLIREAKYYIMENKVIITIVLASILIPTIIYLFINFSLFNKVYKVGSTGNIGDFTYNLISANETINDYNGKIISKNNKYIILNMNITNNSLKDQRFNDTLLNLKYKNNYYFHKPSLRSNFIDIGKGYSGEIIPSKSTRKVIFIFELENKKKRFNYYLNLYKDTSYKDGQEVYNYGKFKIKTKIINDAPERVEKEKKELIHLGNNIFGDSNIVISNSEVLQKYNFYYESCVKDSCREYIDVIKSQDPGNYNLLVIDYKLSLDPKSGLRNIVSSDKDFFEKFLKIEYISKGRKVTNSYAARTYSNIPGKVFIDIPNQVVDSEVFNIIINTRSNLYYIKQ